MARVWTELGRRARNNGKRLYPRTAADDLIKIVLTLKKLQLKITTRRDTEKRRKHYLNLAARLKRDHELFGEYLPGAKCLAAAASFYEKLAAHCEKESPILVDRDTGDPEARFFAVALSTFFLKTLGKSGAHRTIATIASVALGRDISADAVREWCRGRVTPRLGS
jgi:hypothetical protein